MLAEIKQELLVHKPNRVLVYGDTNSNLAGAWPAAKLHIPVARVETGLCNFNIKMPEEINSILTGQISDLLFCPTTTAFYNLENDRFAGKPIVVIQAGDVMQDSAILFAKKAAAPRGDELSENFILATLHRADNTDSPESLANTVWALSQIHQNQAPVVLPLHSRTRKLIAQQGLELKVHLLERCQLVLTDSGGVQKEVFVFGKACVTMRDRAEWVESVGAGANVLVGADRQKIEETASRNVGRKVKDTVQKYGGGEASQKTAYELVKANS